MRIKLNGAGLARDELLAVTQPNRVQSGLHGRPLRPLFRGIFSIISISRLLLNKSTHLGDSIVALATAGDYMAQFAFSAASNVTGIVTDVVAVTRMLKAADAVATWDYAGGAPYLPIDLCPALGALIDEVVLSPHKFVGGPQASGVLIVRCDAVRVTKPTMPGGGTVKFVSPTEHVYAANVESREEAGTPNVVGDLRAALCILVKAACGQDYITQRNRENSERMRAAILSGNEIEKPGFTRLNFSYLASNAEIETILQAVLNLADNAHAHVGAYAFDPATAIFRPASTPNAK